MFRLSCINVTTMVPSVALQTHPTNGNYCKDDVSVAFFNVFCYFALSDIFLSLHISEALSKNKKESSFSSRLVIYVVLGQGCR